MNKFLPLGVFLVVFLVGVISVSVIFDSSIQGHVTYTRSCRSVNKAYVNCVGDNGGCPSRDWRQFSFNIAHVDTCCCVPIVSVY